MQAKHKLVTAECPKHENREQATICQNLGNGESNKKKY
jgi:hypothetical protein